MTTLSNPEQNLEETQSIGPRRKSPRREVTHHLKQGKSLLLGGMARLDLVAGTFALATVRGGGRRVEHSASSQVRGRVYQLQR